ncbi:MAG: hypothetical protein O2779_05620 [Nanoarchaeota archaeon]|nr:hypothetical protein [Nanoarchaeota archaeon]
MRAVQSSRSNPGSLFPGQIQERGSLRDSDRERAVARVYGETSVVIGEEYPVSLEEGNRRRVNNDFALPSRLCNLTSGVSKITKGIRNRFFSKSRNNQVQVISSPEVANSPIERGMCINDAPSFSSEEEQEETTQIKMYKELGKNFSEGEKIDLAKVIEKMPEDNPQERTKFYKNLTKGVHGLEKICLIEEGARISEDQFKKRAKECIRLIKGMSGLNKIAFMRAFAGMPGDHFEERAEIFNKLKRPLDDYHHHQIELISAIAKVPENHFKERVEFFQEEKEGIEYWEKAGFLESIAEIPEDHFKERVGFLKELRQNTRNFREKRDQIHAHKSQVTALLKRWNFLGNL